MVDDDSIGDFNWYDSRPPPLAADDTDCMEGDMGGTEDEVCHGEGHLELPPDIMEPDTFANINMIGTGDEVHSHPELPPTARHFCFATANICTLDVAEMKAATHNGHNGGLALSGRAAILEHQFFLPNSMSWGCKSRECKALSLGWACTIACLHLRRLLVALWVCSVGFVTTHPTLCFTRSRFLLVSCTWFFVFPVVPTARKHKGLQQPSP